MINYICAILLSIAIACGGFGYYEYHQLAALTVEVSTYKLAAQTNLKAKEDADKSCVVTVASLNTYYKEQSSIESSQKSTGDAINTLPTLTIKEKAHAAPTAPQAASTKYADDARLSPDTMRLLDAAYCYGDKDSCATPAK